MKKNISSLLQRGNLKPKERFLLLVANQVSKDRDGKSILTEADEYALSEGWIPANNEEVKEYNRYHEGWMLTGFAELDAQTRFLLAENNLKGIMTLITPLFLLTKDIEKEIDEKLIDTIIGIIKEKNISEKEAIDFVLEHIGYKYKKPDKTIEKLIKEGKLERVEMKNSKNELISGKSIYYLEGDFDFVKDFRKQVDKLKWLGYLILFLKKATFLEYYAVLLAFKELFKRISKVYEIDLTYRIDGWIKEFRKDIFALNGFLIFTLKNLFNKLEKQGIIFFGEIIENTTINLEEIKPSSEREFMKILGKEPRPKEISLKQIGITIADIDRYYQEFKKLFGDEF